MKARERAFLAKVRGRVALVTVTVPARISPPREDYSHTAPITRLLRLQGSDERDEIVT